MWGSAVSYLVIGVCVAWSEPSQTKAQDTPGAALRVSTPTRQNWIIGCTETPTFCTARFQGVLLWLEEGGRVRLLTPVRKNAAIYLVVRENRLPWPDLFSTPLDLRLVLLLGLGQGAIVLEENGHIAKRIDVVDLIDAIVQLKTLQTPASGRIITIPNGHGRASETRGSSSNEGAAMTRQSAQDSFTPRANLPVTKPQVEFAIRAQRPSP